MTARAVSVGRIAHAMRAGLTVDNLWAVFKIGSTSAVGNHDAKKSLHANRASGTTLLLR